MNLAAGGVLVVLGLFGMLLSAHLRSLRFFDRPGIARLRHFDRGLDALKWLLLIAGLGLLLRGSPVTGGGVAAILVLLWAYRRVIRGLRFQARLLRREYESLRRARPGVPDERLLYELAWRRHPGWGPELIEQMVRDHPTIESFGVMVVRMERGYRGFETGLKRR